MCRSIKLLRQPEGSPTDQELYEAALQYVRKISGFRKPARANQEAFDAAVAEIAAASRTLLERLPARKRPAHDHADEHDRHHEDDSDPGSTRRGRAHAGRNAVASA